MNRLCTFLGHKMGYFGAADHCIRSGCDFIEDNRIKGKNMKAFLGGTCNGSTWRNELIPMLEIDYFNPVVDDWTPDCQAEEIRQREECDLVLYVITSDMLGVYSIAEVVDDSCKRPEKTVFCFIRDGFSEAQAKSLGAVELMVSNNGGTVCTDLNHVAYYLNNRF